MIAPHACRQHACIRSVIIVDANIDKHRRVGRSNEPDKLSDGDSVGRGHGASLPHLEVRRRDTSAKASRGDRGQPLAPRRQNAAPKVKVVAISCRQSPSPSARLLLTTDLSDLVPLPADSGRPPGAGRAGLLSDQNLRGHAGVEPLIVDAGGLQMGRDFDD
jgi:hypothetical protein